MRCLRTHFFKFTTFFFALSVFCTAHGQNQIQKEIDGFLENGTEFSIYSPFSNNAKTAPSDFQQEGIDEETLKAGAVFTMANEEKSLTNIPGSFIKLAIPAVVDEEINLLLFEKDIFTEKASVKKSSDPDQDYFKPDAKFYRGVVEGKKNSLVALTIFENEISGLVSFQGKTFVLGRIKDSQNDEHIWYEDKDLLIEEGFKCSAMHYEQHDDDHPEEIIGAAKTNNCVNVKLEIDDDLVTDFGGVTAASNYAAGLMNQVITLFADGGITVGLAEIVAFDGNSPYSGGLSDKLFQMSHSSSISDLTALLTGSDIGGIAFISSLCTSGAVNVNGVFGFFNNVPSYSWDVNVLAHEIGHTLSSPHTHACAWNGNNTAIDGCGFDAGFSEGCDGPIPPNGGTIMSYCHLNSTGVNFSVGFGSQPSTRMINYVNSRFCLDNECIPDPPECEQEPLTLNITTDQYPSETTWEIAEESGLVVAQGGPYEDQFFTFSENLCLTQGCYSLTFFDSFGDGICCESGSGSFSLTYNDQELVTGGEFGSSESFEFCVFPPNSPCSPINFNDYNLTSYVPNRDLGNYEIQDGGLTLFLEDNSLKFLSLGYNVTPDTKLSFEFKSTDIGTLHSIGFDNNVFLTLPGIFKLYGFLNNPLVNSEYAYSSDSGWQPFIIDVGNFFTFNNLGVTFIAANYNGSPGVNSYFRNVRLYEDGECSGFSPSAQSQGIKNGSGYAIFPNPTSGLSEIVTTGDMEIGKLNVFNVAGKIIHQIVVNGNRAGINLTKVPQGVYFIQWNDKSGNVYRDKVIKTK